MNRSNPEQLSTRIEYIGRSTTPSYYACADWAEDGTYSRVYAAEAKSPYVTDEWARRQAIFQDTSPEREDDLTAMVVSETDSERAENLQQQAYCTPGAVPLGDLRSLIYRSETETHSAAISAVAEKAVRTGNEAAVEELQALALDSSQESKAGVFRELATLVCDDPWRFAPETFEILLGCGVREVQEEILRPLLDVVEREPEVLDVLRSQFEAFLESLGPTEIPKPAVHIAALIDPELIRKFEPPTPLLKDVLDTGGTAVEESVAIALQEAGAFRPAEMARATSCLSRLLESSDPIVRATGADASAYVAEEHPELVTPLREELEHCSRDQSDEVKRYALLSLAYLTTERPDFGRDIIGGLVEIVFNSRFHWYRGGTGHKHAYEYEDRNYQSVFGDAIVSVAEAYPSDVEPYLAELDSMVRAPEYCPHKQAERAMVLSSPEYHACYVVRHRTSKTINGQLREIAEASDNPSSPQTREELYAAIRGELNADDPDRRKTAIFAALKLWKLRPERVPRKLGTQLFDRKGDEEEEVRLWFTKRLQSAMRENPNELRTAVPALRRLLDAPTLEMRKNAIRSLETFACKDLRTPVKGQLTLSDYVDSKCGVSTDIVEDLFAVIKETYGDIDRDGSDNTSATSTESTEVDLPFSEPISEEMIAQSASVACLRIAATKAALLAGVVEP